MERETYRSTYGAEHTDSFIKAVQYVVRLTAQQDVLAELGKIFVAYFQASWVALAGRGENKEISIQSYTAFDENPTDLLLSEKIEAIINDVVETGFLATETISLAQPYAATFLPLTGQNQIKAVLVIAHEASTPPSAELLNLYLALAGIAGTTLRRIAMEEDLRKSEERFRTVADLTYDWEYWSGADREFVYISPACERVTGFRPDEFFADPELLDSIVHPDDRGIYEDHLGHYHGNAALGEVTEVFFRIVRRDGRARWIAHLCRPVFGDKGTFLGRRVSNRDFTEKREAEEAMKKYAAELEASNRELQDFAFVASHDLQEPLRKIQAFGDQLKITCAGGLDGEGLDYLNRMQGAAVRMQSLIQALLNYSRIATKAKPFAATDLGAVVRDVLIDLETSIERTGGRVEIGDLPVIEADETQMGQLFQNLIGNGLKFHGEEPPVVRVFSRPVEDPKAKDQSRFYQIFVEDNGIGFDEKYLDRIFAPFQRLHGRGKYEGTGIGLAICRKIVDRHRGGITAESRPGVGSTFIVTLPAQQAEG